MSNEQVSVAPFSRNGEQPAPKTTEQPLAVAGTGLVSILIPCCGQLEYTKLCLPALLRHTRLPFELLFLDIGSLDGTADYLAGVAAARGECLVLLNNDTIVTEGWLHQLLALAALSPAVGLVGPMSNYAAPPQLVETVPYRVGPRRHVQPRGGVQWLVDAEAVHAFAKQYRQEHKGKWAAAERLG